jgi:hypothetical protein
VKFDSIKTILFVTTTEDMDITQFDVRSYMVKLVRRYFWSNRLVLLMMKIPPKFVDWWKRFTDSSNLCESGTISATIFSPLTISFHQ